MLAGLRRSAGAITALALLVPGALASGSIQVWNVKAAVTTADGMSDATHSLKPDTKWPEIALSSGSVLKVTLSVGDEAREALVPAQSFLLLKDKDGEEITLAVGVKPNGRGSVSINTEKLPAAVRAASSPFDATLLLSSPGRKPVHWDLGSITIPTSGEGRRKRHDLPPREGEPAFAPLPEVEHTFRADEKVVSMPSALIGVLGLLLPWGFLLAMIGNVSGGLRTYSPPTMMYVYLACLVGLEGIIVRYWIGWRLYQLLPAFLGLAAITAYVATVALRQARVVRLKAGGTP